MGQSKNTSKIKSKRGSGRECGPCRACCVVTGFDAEPGEATFAKPPNTPCEHLVRIGCGIYETRPPVCRRFQCAWIAAPNLPEGLRPDRCGVMFCTNDHPLRPGEIAVFAYEMRPGALETDLPAWLVEAVQDESTVVLVRSGGAVEILTGEPGLQEELEAAERSRR